MAERRRAQAVAARAQVEPERPVVERRGPGVVAVDEEVALGLYVRVGVLRVALAERDEQALVLGYRLEQRLHGLQAERQRVLDQVGIVVGAEDDPDLVKDRSEEHTSELQSHSFISYAVF